MKYYDIEWRLDSEDNDSDYSDEIPTKKEAFKYANKLIKKYGDRLYLLIIKRWNEEEWEEIWYYDFETKQFVK